MTTVAEPSGPGDLGFSPPIGVRIRRSLAQVRPDAAGRAALGLLGAVGVLVVEFILAAKGAAGPSVISPLLQSSGPSWLAGPLAGLMSTGSPAAIAELENVGLPAMLLLYLLAVLGAPRLRPRLVFGLVALTQLIAILGPATYWTDQISYVDLSRLWVEFHINPYSSVINAGPHVGLLYQRSSWLNLADTYGTLFTILIAPLSALPLAAAYWSIRLLTLAASLVVIWLCSLCAQEVGSSRARAMIFVGLNPLVLYYCVGGGHNDIFAVAPLLGALLLILRARAENADADASDSRWLASERLCFLAGLLLVVAFGMKGSAALCIPPLIPVARRRGALVAGLLAGGIALWVITGVCFDGYLPNVLQQSKFVDPQSFGSVFGYMLGLGGDTLRLQAVMKVLMLLAVAGMVVAAIRRPQAIVGWVTGAGIALVAGLAWVVPWYAIWFVAPASVSRSKALQAACLAITAFMVLTWLPDSHWLVGPAGLPLRLIEDHLEKPFR